MSSSGDIRRDFIITTIGNYFQEGNDKLKTLYSHEHLNDFLDSPRSVILCAKRVPSEIILDTTISLDDDDSSIILFFKTSPDPITPQNMHKNILISTMVDSPVTSLYHVLSNVFMPTLMKNTKWSQNFDTKTTNLMVNLEQTLANIVRHQSNLNSNDNAISSLDNEEHIWQDAISNSRSRDEASAAENILEIVKGINAELKSLTDWTSGSEIFENLTVSLLDLWNMGEKRYPEIRILQILSAIGNTLAQNIQESLKSTNAFTSPFHDFERQITWGISIMDKTANLCNKLTGAIWPNDAARPFKGQKHVPHLVLGYRQRLNEILRIRTVHRQLTLLLSTEEFTELKAENTFAPFVGMSPYLYNSYTEPLWQSAIAKFEKLIGPGEQAIGNKLKSRLSKDYQQFDLLAEFKRYMELIERPKVSSLLRANRESLLLMFMKHTENFEEQLESRNFSNISTISSEPVNHIYQLKQMKAKVKETYEISEKILKDLPNYPLLVEKFDSLSDSISSEEKSCFKDWSSELVQCLRRNELTLKKDEPVIEFADGSRQMEVTYNSKLIQISEETQQLLILGYRIPREVADLVGEAKKFVRQAQQLDQIATFHNTIGDRMIPSQRPMMLETAVALSKMVQDQNGIVWSNTVEVDKYITSLKKLVTNLARQNNQLCSLHIQIKDKVMNLFETDLIKQQQRWKESVKQIRTIIKEVENQGYKNMKSWKFHWDRQLYKALEVQFLLSLSSINENLPEVQAELVYRQGKLQFKPPLEELRLIYYGNIKKFLNIPINFRGVCDDIPDGDQIFPTILKRHAHRFEKIYRDGEALFDRVLSVQGRFVEWIALGSADIETLSKKYLVTAEDWERNFRVSKHKGQEITRLNCSDEKIGCIIISYKLLRLEIELLNRKYWEILVTLLNNSIIQDIVTIERYLQEGIEKLKEDPQSVEEITKANLTKEKLALEMPKTKEMSDGLEKKNKTLVAWTKEKIDLNRVRTLWDNFQSLLENHEHIIGRQVENLKLNLQSQARQLNNEMEHFKLRWDELKPVNSEATKNSQKFDETIEFLNGMKGEWAKLMEKQGKIAESCENLHVDNVEFPYIEDVDADLASISKVWEKLAEFRGGLKEFEEEDWIIFRAKPYRFEEFLHTWDETFRAEPKSDLIIRMLRDIESYSGLITNLKFIRGDIFNEKHWYELYSLLEMQSKPLGQLKVGDFLQARGSIGDKVKELKELNTRASGEIVVQQALNELDGWEIEAKFILIENQDSQNRTISIIQDFKSVLNKLGDNQSLLQSIRTSPFYSNFADRITVWETRLADIDEYLQSLNKIQRRWIYLEPIFSHGVLETEQQRFRRIDDDFRLIMDKIKSDSRVVNLCKIPGIRNRLNMLLDQLARCQSSLNEFLERKRSGFPRFYFIGDDDLLEILGQSTKPAVIQAHLKKLFAGIYNVEFDPEEQFITAMKSLEGEGVLLKSKVKIVPNVEEWLSELSSEMKYTLKSSLLDCISDVKHHSRDLNLDKYPAQILCLGNSIVFTERCEDAIRSGRLSDYLNKLKEELHFYTNYNLGNSENLKVLELKLKDLILDIIHEMDIVEYLAGKRIGSGSDWSWQKQLRFYIRDDGCAVVRMADAEFLYSYEYQGNAQKLVHTPLTDKCYLTLTQGMRMGLGGNPYGPAGTGKTESVKALGGMLGRQVLVFNCDEGIDVKAMGRIFIGLSKCGAWGCFDEFNRLEGATLSAVSMQIQPIQTALKQGAPSVVIMDELVPLDGNAGIFVTLNPAGKGYGGRNKLPDNLKQLFRPVVMSQPDNERIAEVILYTEGFKGAKKLGKKLVEIFNLSGKLLTPQKHYDWGLRALKTVLKGCGTALKDFKKQNESSSVNEKDENDLVVATLRLNTLPKLTHSDCFRFDNLIKDVFPNAIFQEWGHQDLAETLKEACKEMHLAVNENQVRKCLELYEQLQQRMGVVIVGPPSCGKSTVISVLKQALMKTGQKIKSHIINPKAMPRTHLLGHINLDTRQWTDGVLTMKAQQVYSEPPDVTSWIICDGDIDPEWVESLNSVLDDNRLLTLPSGWRIKFGPNVNFIFETHDLSYASPATISRMGMIFMSDEDADIKGIVSTWLEEEPPEDQQLLAQIIEDHFYEGLKWILQHEGQISLPTVSVVKNALSLMAGTKSVSNLAIAMIRGLGGHLAIQQAIEFSKEVFSWTQQSCPGIGRSINFYYSRNQDRIDIYQDDDMEQSQEFQFNQLPLVRTANVKRVLDHISPWLSNQESFILIGPEGCGKSMILEAAFSELRSTEVATLHCSGLITPENVLQKLSQVCITISTNAGRVYKSKDGERLILYFKGVNLVKPDKWGTCQVVEFLQQILSYDGFYDKNLEWVGVRGIQIVASISVATPGGLYTLSPRFLSRLRVCTMTQPEPEQLFTICNSYLSSLFQTHLSDHPASKRHEVIESLAQGMVTVYKEVRNAFTPVHQTHYQFTPRELTKWVLGLMRYDMRKDGEEAMKDLYNGWAFEGCRIFRDKLVSQEEKTKFDDTIISPVLSQWNMPSVKSLFEETCWISGPASFVINSSVKTNYSPLFGNTLYKSSLEELITVVGKGMVSFGRENRELNIVVIPELLNNVAYIDRILSFPCSSVVLAGRAGVGRRTALSIVSALHRATILTLKVGRNYGLKSFKNDLKAAIQMSAVEGNRVFFVVEDFQLVDKVFLDMLNSLLSSGEIPGLYSPEELETIIAMLRDTASTEGYNSSLYSYFALRVRRLMNIILIMDYTNENFIPNCQSNPAIYKQCSMIWLDNWSARTQKMIPLSIIKKFYEKTDGDHTGFTSNESEKRQQFISGFKIIFQSLPKEWTYPRRYVTLIHNYATLYNQKRVKIVTQVERLKAGVAKLNEAKEIVEKLKADAAVQEETLAEKQSEANKALEMITITMKSANMQRGEMQELKQKTLQENEILLEQKKSIDAELKEIEPMVAKSKSAVGSIKNEALSEIRSLRAPPDVIRDILEGVLRMMGIRDMSWNSMKTFLAKRGVKDDIRNFDARNVHPEDREAVEKLLRFKQESFEPKNAKRASAAAAPLAEWVIANVRFSMVLEKIEPLERKQRLLEENLRLAESQMDEISSELMSVDERVQQLKGKLNQYTKEAAEIEFHLSKAKGTLLAAEGLVGKLDDEFGRWKVELQDLDLELDDLPLNSLLAAAFITYLCDASEDLRKEYLSKWGHQLEKSDFDFCKFLSSERDLLQWQSLGLPSDRLSQENAIMIFQLSDGNVTTCSRPYLIDPSSRATEWLKNFLSLKRPPTVISLQHPNFQNELELAVRFGKILVVLEADIIEPILVPILRGDLVSQGSREVVQIADKNVDYNPDFRLFLCTRNPNPVINPDAAAVLTVVNFTTTRAGLTSQLLSTTLSFEKPEIETKKKELVKNIESLKIELSTLGETLLHELASAQGNILENKELLESLNKTKASSLAITESLSESSELEESLNNEISDYLPFAVYGSCLYFAIIDASKLNNMYQFSLTAFAGLFERALKHATVNSDLQTHITQLKSALESLVYEYVCRSLFKSDRLAFALHLSHAMHPEYFQEHEWEAFTGQLVTDLKGSAASKDSVPSWIDEDRNFPVYLLSAAFPNLYEKMALPNQSLWEGFYARAECEEHIPQSVREQISNFQKIMLIQTLRPDRLHTVMSDFARAVLGRKALFPPPTNLRQIVKETVATEPILILVSAGADPSSEMRELAHSAVGSQRYIEISMGQGQIDMALEKLKQGAQVGHWICMKNLHLVTHWLDTLEKEVKALTPHESFRLWLTSEPHPSFPKILLQTCLKVAYEAPPGLKKNLQRTYGGWTPQYVVGDKNIVRTQSLFVLALFHAVVQERRTYIPQGWSKFYEFNESDLRAGADVLDQLFKGNRSREIQWPYVHGLFEQAIYGGRIDNDYDLRVLVSYLSEYFSENILTGANPSRRTVGPAIKLPNTTDIQEYYRLIESMPEYDRPSSFGLPTNIERSWQRIESSQVIGQLKTLSRRFSDTVKFDKALWHQELTPLLNLWKKLNQGQGTMSMLQEKLQQPDLSDSDSATDPMDAFVKLEYFNVVTLMQSVHKTLGTMSKVIRGILVPTEGLVNTADSLLKRETPAEWLKQWDGPIDAMSYLQCVVTRAIAIQKWKQRSKEGSILRTSVDLSDLMNPDTFLSAFKQHCARKLGVAMDELVFVCAWDRNTVSAGKLSCQITGLLLEGCSFNGVKLVENTAESAPIVRVGDCTIAWMSPKDSQSQNKTDKLSVPLYYNETRQKLIGSLEFPSQSDDSKWVQAGVALFLKN